MCGCIKKVNAKLKERGLTISTISMLNLKTGKARETVFMTTERLSGASKVRRQKVCPTFCPFCGERCVKAEPAQ